MELQVFINEMREIIRIQRQYRGPVSQETINMLLLLIQERLDKLQRQEDWRTITMDGEVQDD